MEGTRAMNDPFNNSTLGVCVFPEPAANRGRTVNYPGYIHELLAHAGVCYETIGHDDWSEKLPGLKVLVTVGDRALDARAETNLRRWIAAGGMWLSISGLCGLEDVLGVERLAPCYDGWGTGIRSLGEGYLQPICQHRILEFAAKPIHFFGGIHVRATEGMVLAGALDEHGAEDASPAIIETTFGLGRSILIAVDLTGTIVRVQQGVSVTRDGVPARDGSAPIDDAVLKSGDGGVLDWKLDRDGVPGAKGLSAFLRPVADQWQEILLRSIFYLAELASAMLPILWMYPRNLPSLGHISHDTDHNEPEKAKMLLASLARAEIQSTWCVIVPGYSGEIIDDIRRAGHELAMHYDAMTPGLPWSQMEFEKQHRFLTDLLSQQPITNKNHYLRWEGDMEFYTWLESHGIQLDQSKGPSKIGEAGFNFGTSHPYFPVRFDGGIANVLELPTLSQDLSVFGPECLGVPLLEAALRYHGIAHFLFHPSHFDKPATAPAMENIIAEGRKRGLEWWTAERINSWERARRTVTWKQFVSHGDQASVQLRGELDMPDTTCLWLTCGHDVTLSMDGNECAGTTVRRWGFEFKAATFDLPRKTRRVITVQPRGAS
jgi:hypothetical protein